MLPRFERFIQERRYLKNVSPRTIEWYEQSLAWLTLEQPTADDLRHLVVRMREAGLKASSCNCHIRLSTVICIGPQKARSENAIQPASTCGWQS